MAGLFGIVHLTPATSDQEWNRSRSIFGAMATALRHHETDVLDELDVPGAAVAALIGRIGGRHQNAIPWVSATAHRADAGPLIAIAGSPTHLGVMAGNGDLGDPTDFASWGGPFAAALADPAGGPVTLIADRTASWPIFFARTESRLLFAPEVKALLVDADLSRSLDWGALAAFLAQGYLLADQTLFSGVRRLRGGETLQVHRGQVAVARYWQFSPGAKARSGDTGTLARRLGELVSAAAGRHLGDPAKAVIFLSGGADSRGILGGAMIAAGGRGDRLNTVSWGAAHPPRDSDVDVAMQIARSVGTRHRVRTRELTDYRARFERSNRLIDGLSEMAAFHPHEHQIMLDLRSEGFERVLRGDEAFGWSFPAATIDAAAALVKLRPLRHVGGWETVIRPEHLARLRDASDSAMANVLAEVKDLPPNQAKDYLYFSHRLQCYLHTASYYKQIELDQRNVLLDDTILDFMSEVPDDLRVDKQLYREALPLAYPALAKFPYARLDNLEDWGTLLFTDTPVRAYAREELGDGTGGLWDILDPAALSALLSPPGLPSGEPRRPVAQRAKGAVKRVVGAVAPFALRRYQTSSYSRQSVRAPVEKIVLRSLVLKHWYEEFVRGAPSKV